jgi:aminoglycoside phosphotransferase (APT) family kinase protein
MDPLQLLRLINARHGAGLVLVERYADGEQGAYAVRDGSGRRLVLKWAPDPARVRGFYDAARVTRALADRGYPAPRYALIGAWPQGAFVLQETLAGISLRAVTSDHLPRLLTLNDLQAGMAAPAGLPDAGWPAPVVDPVLHGGDGFCLLETMRRHSAETAELLELLQRQVTRFADEPCSTADVVHYDFNPLNILTEEGEITGVVDWEAACAGDRAFDVATLLFYSYGDEDVRRRLWSRLLELARPGIATVYLSHLIHRQVEWSIRHHSARIIEHWLRVTRTVLDDLRELPDGAPAAR